MKKNQKNISSAETPISVETAINQNQESVKNPYRVFYDNYMQTTNSATECTGLIPNGDTSLEEWEHYKDVFPFGG